jgi:DNA-binding MarR family transcriptional regulator
MCYVRLCVQDMQGRLEEAIDVVDVRRVISIDVISRDMDLELSGFLKFSERGLAVAAISALMAEGEMNQKDLAVLLGVTQNVVSRLLGKLEHWGYVSRTRGVRKELKVSIKN